MNQIKLPYSDDTVFKLTTLFGAVADTTRAKIILFLKDGEKRSSDIADMLMMSSSATSHQLRWLYDNQIVQRTKRGREVYYALDDGCIDQMMSIALDHIQED